MSESIVESIPPQPELEELPDRDRVVISGAGFSGTVTAIRLLRHSLTPLEVVIMEKDEALRDGGLAYSDNSAGEAHLLNIQAGRITAFREHPKDFMDWANREADRTAWPSVWQDVAFEEPTAVQRRSYQQYLGDRLKQAEADAAPGVTLRRINAEVIDAKTAEDGSVLVTYKSSDDGTSVTKELKANRGILATGHVDFIVPEAAEPVKTHPRFVTNQYSAEGREAISSLPKRETAFILGTGLTAYDAAVSLLENGHEGPIIMSSRHGYRHFTYPKGHVHEILRVRRPPFMDAEQLTVDDVVNGVKEELSCLKEQLQEQRPDISETIHTERILKAWEPYVAELAQRLPAEDIKQLLAKYRSLTVTSRIGTIPEIGNRIANGMEPQGDEPPQIQVLKGTVIDMSPVSEDGRIAVTMHDLDGNPVVITAGLVITGIGQEADYTKVSSPLWQNLVHRHRSAVPHAKTGRGIEVGPYGEVVNSQGEISDSLFAVGPMRQGDEIQRRGRLGAFVFSIGTVRNQCFETAVRVIDSLEHPNDRLDVATLGQAMDDESVAAAIAREVAQSSAEQDTAEVTAPALEVARYAVRLCLSEPLIAMEKTSLESTGPTQKKTVLEEIRRHESQLSTELVRHGGLPEAIALRVVQQASRYRTFVALRRLTDIAYLAKGLGREEYTVSA
jgi:uncharacterized NAD(P)/FAD-binding protein YdhS